MYENLINKVIDKTHEDFVDFPSSLDGEIYLSGNSVNGWKTKVIITQEELDLIELNRQKEIKKELLSEITVTTANGNTFDGDDVARVDMLNAILASETLGLTEHPWKLANNEWMTIQIEELKEASALAIMRKGEILAG